MIGMDYSPHNFVGYRFLQHVQFALAPNINRFGYDKNLVEKLGDLGLWFLEKFPGKFWSLMKEPRWITLALTNIALAGVSYLFYSKESIALARAVWLRLPLPSRETVKFGVYLIIVVNIASAALRALGRFYDGLFLYETDMYKTWYGAKSHASGITKG